jgi:hypothetical protein
VRSSASGMLLLLIALLGLAGFVTGNLDRWIGYLFDPSRPPLGGSTPAPPAAAPGATTSLVSLAGTSQRRTA